MKKNNTIVLEPLWSNKPIPSVSLIDNFEMGVDNTVKWNSEHIWKWMTLACLEVIMDLRSNEAKEHQSVKIFYHRIKRDLYQKTLLVK